MREERCALKWGTLFCGVFVEPLIVVKIMYVTGYGVKIRQVMVLEFKLS